MFGRKRIGDIISGLTKTVQDLEQLQVQNDAERTMNIDAIDHLVAVNKGLVEEAERASKIADNINKLLGS